MNHSLAEQYNWIHVLDHLETNDLLRPTDLLNSEKTCLIDSQLCVYDSYYALRAWIAETLCCIMILLFISLQAQYFCWAKHLLVILKNSKRGIAIPNFFQHCTLFGPGLGLVLPL